MYKIMIIGCGGFLGAVSRYMVSGFFSRAGSQFPYGTLAVNFIGSFLLSAILFFSAQRTGMREDLQMFLTIGFLGAFTTMSTFSYESFKLFEQDQLGMSFFYMSATVLMTLLAVYLGKYAVVTIVK